MKVQQGCNLGRTCCSGLVCQDDITAFPVDNRTVDVNVGICGKPVDFDLVDEAEFDTGCHCIDLGALCGDENKCNHMDLDFERLVYDGSMPPGACVNRYKGLSQTWRLGCGCIDQMALYCDSGLPIKNFDGLTLKCVPDKGWYIMVYLNHNMQRFTLAEFVKHFNMRCEAPVRFITK